MERRSGELPQHVLPEHRLDETDGSKKSWNGSKRKRRGDFESGVQGDRFAVLRDWQPGRFAPGACPVFLFFGGGFFVQDSLSGDSPGGSRRPLPEPEDVSAWPPERRFLLMAEREMYDVMRILELFLPGMFAAFAAAAWKAGEMPMFGFSLFLLGLAVGMAVAFRLSERDFQRSRKRSDSEER